MFYRNQSSFTEIKYRGQVQLPQLRLSLLERSSLQHNGGNCSSKKNWFILLPTVRNRKEKRKRIHYLLSTKRKEKMSTPPHLHLAKCLRVLWGEFFVYHPLLSVSKTWEYLVEYIFFKPLQSEFFLIFRHIL